MYIWLLLIYGSFFFTLYPYMTRHSFTPTIVKTGKCLF